MIKVSRTMSTQHPDNVRSPFFSDNSLLSGEDEIKEAFYAFSHLKSREQLWDCEGKEVDAFVVKKLLTKYETWFQRHKLGKEVFLTLRVPNPNVEKGEAKVLLETLESIPRSFDAAKTFYGEDIAPIFEISLPMTASYKDLVRVSEYYKQIVVGKEKKSLFEGDIPISKWIGKFRPERINIIPLIEDKESMLDSDKIVSEYVKKEKVEDYQRVWLARSDPALNYSNLAAVLINKIALQKLHKLQDELSIEILPIIGCGSAPFRGNFKPSNVENCMKGYPSVYTFTLQSAFKYDNPEEEVRQAVRKLEETKPKKPTQVNEEKCLEIIEKSSSEYQKHIKLVAPYVNKLSRFMPDRRKRKLHVGLFGYSRTSAGIKLPRAIKFCASLYSLGFPPEILGLTALDEKDLDYVKDVYVSFENDLKDALLYFNEESLKLFPQDFANKIRKTLNTFDFEIDKRHKKITSIVLDDFRKNRETLKENIERAAHVRNFLG